LAIRNKNSRTELLAELKAYIKQAPNKRRRRHLTEMFPDAEGGANLQSPHIRHFAIFSSAGAGGADKV
jgi:hypothetical protein